MKIHSTTHQGLIRNNNEDCYLVEEYEDGSVLLVVADGMGGHSAGEVAARMATESLAQFKPGVSSPEEHLVDLVLAANYHILDASIKDETIMGMGTTLTALFLREQTGYWAHVGDSRLYLYRAGRLTQITDDHTIPGILLKKGGITKEMQRIHPLNNVLVRCIGCEECEPDAGSFEIKEKDLIFLSTDGLHDLVREERVIAILESKSGLEAKSDALINAALEIGGTDNITVVMAEL